MIPKSCKNLIGIITVLKFLIKLIRTACDGNATIKPNQSIGQISQGNPTVLKDLMHDARFIIMQEHEQKLNEARSHVWVTNCLLL